jgi:hypothetical protein
LLDAKVHQIFSIEPTESVLRAIEIMATRHTVHHKSSSSSAVSQVDEIGYPGIMSGVVEARLRDSAPPRQRFKRLEPIYK